jgi:CDP-diacylglycerol--glycerol-3-phosphate 3-phosphatidyltransferase
MTSFHTYAAKLAALSQGVFLILFFFLGEQLETLFYFTIAITALDLVEEIILVLVIRQWATDVKGLYWVLRKKQH